MKPLDNSGAELRSTFSVAGEWPQLEVTFESGDGRGRNTDYKPGLDAVLSRLAMLDAVLVGARITSEPLNRRVAEVGTDPTFVPTGMTLPLRVSSVDPVRLRRAIGNAGGRVDSAPDTSGSTTRRTTLDVTLGGSPIALGEIELMLAGRTAVGAPALQMLTDIVSVDAAIAVWLAALEEGARPLTASLRWSSSDAFTFSSAPSSRRSGAVDVQLGVRTTGEPWSAEINAPATAGDSSGLSNVARDASGRKYLLRQGWLRANPDSAGDVRDDRFRTLSGLTPVVVTGAPSRIRRDWYVVADLGQSTEVIRAQTGAFTHACNRARLSSRGVRLPPVPSRSAPGEKGGTFRRKAVEAQPEQEFVRQHGEIWLELSRALERAGRQLVKLRHDGGYEVDGIILHGPSRILVEIKTGASAGDVYEGFGQLFLYSRLMELQDCQRVLLLTGRPNELLLRAAEAEGVRVHHCSCENEDGMTTVTFSDEFRAFCGFPADRNA
jgi:hypothetical protein